MVVRSKAHWLVALAFAIAACDGGEPADGDADVRADGDADADSDADADGDADADATSPDGDAGDEEVDAEQDHGGDADEPVDPSTAGPHTWTLVDDRVVRGSRTTPVQALVPDAPGGETFPLVLFLPGFQMNTAWYLPLLERLASHGFVVVRADPPASLFDTDHPEMMLDAQAVLDWALDPTGAVGPRVDAAHVAAAGHSTGGKISTMLAFADPRVTALFGLDPINARSPFGFTEEQPDIVPDMVSPLALPWGMVGETTDIESRPGGQACAPAELNFQTFYDAAAASPWIAAWELVGADHVDFVYDTAACGIYCRFCVEGSTEAEVVRATTETLAVAFLRFHFLGEAEMETWLVGERLPAGVVLQHRP